MSDCLFCKIIAGEIPSQKVYEDEFAFGFQDIRPAAPQHYLIIPKQHIESLAQLTPKRAADQGIELGQFMGSYYQSIMKFIEERGLHQNGFRLVTNTGKQAGQTVFHLHTHVLSGKQMSAQMA